MKPLILGAGCLLYATVQAYATPSQAAFEQCLTALSTQSTFASVRPTLAQYRPSTPDASVLEALNYQPEFKKDVWDYLSVLVDTQRVADGIAAKNAHAKTLIRIQERYGVDMYHILGVWGVESNFGQTMGRKDLFRSLATLSCFDRRQSYFRKEFANALKIVQEGHIPARQMTGSWAGAFGQTQFMPSTFLELAQDFDGDGKKDIVTSVPDALASTANFLAKKGYKSNEVWGYEVRLPAGYSGSTGRKNKQNLDYYRSRGVVLPNGAPLPSGLSQAGLLLPAGKGGPAFLVGKNFDTLYAYNASENYALAIAHLSDLIKKSQLDTSFATPWPTDDPGISRAQAKQIQSALLALGYDIGAVDGIIGDATRRAIRDWQQKEGLTPNGRAGQKLYQTLVGR